MRKAFTFVEVMVSILIMSFLTVVWISSFQNYFSSQDMRLIWVRFNEIIKWLDLDIKTWKLSSYKLTAMTWWTAVIVEKNFYRVPELILFTWVFDLKYLSWSLNTKNISTWTWLVKTYLDNKHANSYVLNWSWDTLSLSFSWILDFDNMDIISSVSSVPTNSFEIFSIAPEDWTQDWKIKAEIDSLSWSSLFDSIEIENVLWSKRMHWYIWTTSSDIQDISVFISKASKDYEFKISLK